MRELLEIGFVFRGFILINHSFKELPGLEKKKVDAHLDPRGSFISAINSFAQTAFENNFLEYLESGNLLFIFKFGEVKSKDSTVNEPIIIYGLVEKTKRNSDKLVKAFLKRAQPILDSFIKTYYDKDFTEVNQFMPFKQNILDYF